MFDNASTDREKEWKKLIAEFQHKSDRAAAILGSVYLEAYLGQLIACFFVDDEAETAKLLDEERPLGNFGARIRAAYCMGLISKTEYHDLELILDIRSRFANQVEILSFAEDGIRELCLRLKIPRKFLLPGETRTPRDLFVFTSTILAQHLALRSAPASNKRCAPPDEFMMVDAD